MMAPQVDFYVLDLADLSSRYHFCCRLLAKIFSQRQRCTVLVDDQATASALDDALWQNPPESFLPHQIVDSASEGSADAGEAISIRISDQAPREDVCINLRAGVPANHAQLSRLVEIVCQDPNVLNSTREKYRFYRELAYPLQSHPIKSGTQ